MMAWSRSLVLVAWIVGVCRSFSFSNKIDHKVRRLLTHQDTVDVLVTMKPSQSSCDRLDSFHGYSRGDKLRHLVSRMEQHVHTNHQILINISIQHDPDPFAHSEIFWLTNQLYLHKASASFVKALVNHPIVVQIRLASKQTADKLASRATRYSAPNPNGPVSIEWGVAQVGAPSAWQQGVFGDGVVVGIIDSGVRYSHEAIRDSFRGEYGWYDPQTKSSVPYDPVGHGTHVTAIIVGANGTGVAPGAQWMACKGGSDDGGYDEIQLLKCLQFMTCPTDTTGEHRDCSKAPHVVSNSWHAESNPEAFNQAVETWLQAGIIPVFAAGNFGPFCDTVLPPADHPKVITVGATDSTNALATFSSRGGSDNQLHVKPTIVAPGVGIRSAWNTSDTAYQAMSGTSFAVPHVVGAIALMLSSAPNITLESVRQSLQDTSFRRLSIDRVRSCGGISETSLPNNEFGYGRLDASAALMNSIEGNASFN